MARRLAGSPPAKTVVIILTLFVGVVALFARPAIPVLKAPPLVPRRYYGIASWYGGREPLNTHTASGTVFDRNALTAAMWGVPFGAHARITNLLNGETVTVEVNDRGPAWWLPWRVVDLSPAAFGRLSPLKRGLIPVAIELWWSN